MDTNQHLIRRLLKVAGTPYAAEAGIRLDDKPMPLFQLLVFCMLASKPIDAAVAARAARELFHNGVRTPQTVLAADRDTMIRAFGRAGYARYDESSADRLTDIATRARDDYSGDLRTLSRRADRESAAAVRLLKQFKGIGDTGANIFLREAQDVWTWARPYFDERTLTAAANLGLPTNPSELSALAPRRNARLAAALVRVALDDEVHQQVALNGGGN